MRSSDALSHTDESPGGDDSATAFSWPPPVDFEAEEILSPDSAVSTAASPSRAADRNPTTADTKSAAGTDTGAGADTAPPWRAQPRSGPLFEPRQRRTESRDSRRPAVGRRQYSPSFLLFGVLALIVAAESVFIVLEITSAAPTRPPRLASSAVSDTDRKTRSGDLKAADLQPILNQPIQLEAWRAAGGGACGLQIDTGMSRLGFRPEDAPAPFEGLDLVMSHLACADAPADSMNRQQREAFAAISARYPGAIRSFSNSGGCFMGADFAFDAVRPGICLYGGGPEGRPDDCIRPVATLSAEVVQVRPVPKGETVGYSAGWTAPQDSTIAIVAAGYADGVLRSYSPRGKVWLAGALRPIVGRVSMDVIAVDVTDADVAVGDLCEIYGPNRNIDDQATAAGTIAYELLTSITPRVPRVYIG